MKSQRQVKVKYWAIGVEVFKILFKALLITIKKCLKDIFITALTPRSVIRYTGAIILGLSTSWTLAHQAPPSKICLEFSRHEYGSG